MLYGFKSEHKICFGASLSNTNWFGAWTKTWGQAHERCLCEYFSSLGKICTKLYSALSIKWVLSQFCAIGVTLLFVVYSTFTIKEVKHNLLTWLCFLYMCICVSVLFSLEKKWNLIYWHDCCLYICVYVYQSYFPHSSPILNPCVCCFVTYSLLS